MSYLLCSRRRDGAVEYRRAEHVIDAYRMGRFAIAEGEISLRFIRYEDDLPEITEDNIRESIAARTHYRAAYAQAGLPDPYHGAPL